MATTYNKNNTKRLEMVQSFAYLSLLAFFKVEEQEKVEDKMAANTLTCLMTLIVLKVHT